MKSILVNVFLLFAGALAYGQDTKNIVYDAKAEVRKVGEFNGIEVSSAIALYLSQGSENAIAISDDDNASKVKTEVVNGVLKIYVEGNFWNKWRTGDKMAKAYVTVRNIEKIVANGASLVRITDKITSPNLKITLNGASNLKGDIVSDLLKLDFSGASSSKATLNCKTVQVDLSGASSGSFTGNTDNLDVEVSGASSLKAFDLIAATCNARASGASSVRINVTKQLTKLEASGASSIHYKGNAFVKNVDASGASSIKKESR